MRILKTAILVLGVFSLLLGIVYPLVVTGIARLVFPHRAGGSLITRNGRVIGSELIGQAFTDSGYFHGRPSDCNYQADRSASANLGPSNPVLLARVQARVDSVRAAEALTGTDPIPADLVLASASGLDPDISPQSARLQVPRIARVRGLPAAELELLIARRTTKPCLGVFGEAAVNVLKLNLALDSISDAGGNHVQHH